MISQIDWQFFLLCYAGVVSTLALVCALLACYGIRNWQRIVLEQKGLRDADWRLLGEHQDILANHESRLVLLRTQGLGPVLTMDQLIEAQRRRTGQQMEMNQRV